MKFPKPQGVEERNVLDSVFKEIREEWGFAKSFGPSRLLEKWERFVKDVEEGYSLSIYDYTHELSMRDLLENVKERVPVRLRQEIEVALRPWDARFMQATQPSDRPIEPVVDEDAKEWWYRLPKHAGWDVERYLIEGGFRGRRNDAG